MNCKLCTKPVIKGKNSSIVGSFAIHDNCIPGKKNNPKQKGKVRNFQPKKKSKQNHFIASPIVRGWRDV